MADWGQGASNNDIDWGQGAVNNDISWGSVYAYSYSGNTNIIGSLVFSIVNGFQIRVLADGGTFEAESCLVTFLNTIV